MDNASRQTSRDQQITRRRFLQKAGAAALFMALPLDAVLIEPKHIQVTQHNVVVNRLPRELDGLKLAQISDLHRSSIVPDSLIKSSIEVVNSLKPDLTVITGDFVSEGPSNARECAKMLSAIRSPLGVFGVLGNHDHWTGLAEVTNYLKSSGIHLLVNESIEVASGLALLGLDDFWVGKPDFNKTWKGVDPNVAHIFLCHNPLGVRKVRDKDCFMISGHTHGGQANIPFIPRSWLPGLLGWKYIKGWYQEGRVQMYVNRGIGMIKPPVRFLCRPEVSLFVLRSTIGTNR